MLFSQTYKAPQPFSWPALSFSGQKIRVVDSSSQPTVVQHYPLRLLLLRAVQRLRLLRFLLQVQPSPDCDDVLLRGSVRLPGLPAGLQVRTPKAERSGAEEQRALRMEELLAGDGRQLPAQLAEGGHPRHLHQPAAHAGSIPGAHGRILYGSRLLQEEEVRV